jgi:membrane associated rhomboid family serine protease
MFGGLENGTTYKRYWSELQIGFKYLVVATLAFGVVGIFTNLPAFLFSDVLVYTVNKFQIWRLVTSFLVDMSIINVIFNLYMLSMSLPEVVCL